MIVKMKRPRVGQRVWAEGFDGTFTVVKICAPLGVADLELTSGMKKIQVHLPFLGQYTQLAITWMNLG
jgi:hypothetical protein